MGVSSAQSSHHSDCEVHLMTECAEMLTSLCEDQPRSPINTAFSSTKSELAYLQNLSSTSPRICKGLIDFDNEDLVREACSSRGVDGW